MSEVFLDTTAVIDLNFKSAEMRRQVEMVCPTGGRRTTSQYVLYELARGYLRNLILLHNKATQLTRFSDLTAYAANNRRHSHRLGTILRAFQDFFREGLSRGVSDKITLPPDEAMLASFRAYLSSNIRRNWKKALNSVTNIVDDVQCRRPIEAPYLKDRLYWQDLRKENCGSVKCCGLKAYVARNREDFVRLREELQQGYQLDPETKRRIKALRELYRVAKTDFERDDCYSCGDAIIAHEAPCSVPVITSNRKHFAPICKALGKTAIYYPAQ